MRTESDRAPHRDRDVPLPGGTRRAVNLVDGTPSHIPPVAPPTPVVASNGAEDPFAAGCLFGRLTGEPAS
ncbi:hypothetical protein ABT147_04015 [Streptomyces sp. NPDC001868]|uniref:hypothetical protein n=1 Tax=Streptomyces sp. NPDC001868 TaxID=3154401 RepID=UPI00332014D1